MRVFLTYASILIASLPALFRTRREQAVIEMALSQQLATYAQKQRPPRLTAADRGFWVALRRFWPRWRSALLIVRPETVVHWHRKGFRLYWRSLSRPGPGRPRVSPEVRALIRRLAAENSWRTRRIQAELEKLGIRVSLATVSRYLLKPEPDRNQRQRLMTFLCNHREVISAMDFLVVPTLRFKLLYVWFVIGHGRREVLHVNVYDDGLPGSDHRRSKRGRISRTHRSARPAASMPSTSIRRCLPTWRVRPSSAASTRSRPCSRPPDGLGLAAGSLDRVFLSNVFYHVSERDVTS